MGTLKRKGEQFGTKVFGERAGEQNACKAMVTVVFLDRYSLILKADQIYVSDVCLITVHRAYNIFYTSI